MQRWAFAIDLIDHLAIAARVQAAAVKVYAVVAAHAVEMPAAKIAFSAPASTPAVLEDGAEVAGAGHSTEAVGVAGRGGVLQACLGQPDSYSLEACACKHSHWRLAGLG